MSWMKARIKYKRSSHYKKVRIGKNESARKKFEDECKNENKYLIKNFIDTIVRYIIEFINMKRRGVYV